MFALRRTFHTTARRLQTIPLARQVFDPPAKTGTADSTSSSGDGKKCAPIVFLHGLFGSKQNSRSISK
ncbi:hypothetical protein KEM55_003894 [Ascosphaera atra]|nr:hypothetical protein KEM55_003894 [Ascosphaera atra]